MPRKRTKEGKSRFVEMEDEEVESERKSLEKKNTVKADKKSHKILSTYLQARDFEATDMEYWKWDDEKINKVLSKFWFEVRAQDGDYYRVSSMKNLFYGLNRCFSNNRFTRDIVKHPAFMPTQKAFIDACKRLKNLGLGYVESYKEISPEGMCFFTKKQRLTSASSRHCKR